MNKARLFVVSAPSGCGKGTILSEVFKNSDVFYSVSCTTRDPREGEVDGVHYHFIDDVQFERMAAENGFLEHAGFVKHYYGTPVEPVIRNLSEGRDVVLEIETNGAFQVKKAMPEAVLIFILPPSVEELKRRLNKRGTESKAVIEERVKAATDEIAKAYDYDYAIMNDGLEDAVRDFETVMRSAKEDSSEADVFRTENKDIKNMIDEVLKNA